MKNFSLIFSIFLIFCSPVFSDVYDNHTTLEQITHKIPQMKSIQCKFKQEKHLKNIQKPLVSNGDFEFIENKGVYFHTKYPVESTVDYTNKNYKQINDIVKAISTKKYSKLEKEFDFYYQGKTDNWTFGMKPKINSGAFNYISNITLSGADYITKISISQTNGNKTIIWFTK